MNKNYETVIIFTPVLNEEEVKKQIKKYVDLIKEAGGSILHENHWGLRQMAYPIQKKTTGIYHIIEYDAPGEFIDSFELQFRRDENVIRFLTTALDKFSLDYNERKRNGLIGRKKEPKVSEPAASSTSDSTATKTVEAPAVVAAPPVVEAPAVVAAPPVVEPEIKVEEVVEPVVVATPEPVVEAAPEPTVAETTPIETPPTPETETNTEPEQKTDEA